MKKQSRQKGNSAEASTTRAVRLVLAGYILVLLVLQLFTFEQFPRMIESVGIGGAYSYAIAIALVVVELIALPYLLAMKVPGRLSVVSLVSLILAMIGLSALELVAYMAEQTVIFGATFSLPGGSWSLLFMAALWVLALWGMLGGRLTTKGSR